MPNLVQNRRRWNEGVVAAGGLMHRAAGFGGSQSLTNANSGGALTPHGGTSPMACLWFQASNPASGATQLLFQMGTGTPAGDILGVQLTSAGVIQQFSSNGSGYSLLSDPVGAIAANTWYFLELIWGGTTNQMTVYDLAGVTARGGSTASNGPQVNVNKPITLGNHSSGANPLSGRIDSFGWWPQGVPAALTFTGNASDPLWHNGQAIDASQVIAISPTNLVAFINFDQASGSSTWTDNSGGGNDLTATGTVTSQPGAGF